MIVTHRKQLENGHSIEIGDATWDESETSIRDRWTTSTGGFNPRQSSEVPVRSMIEMIGFAADHDIFSLKEIAEMVGALWRSLCRQCP